MTTDIQEPRVLIGDDSPILNNLLKDLFEDHGFEVHQALDGPGCKNVARNHRLDIAFIDVNMPGLDGLEVLRYMKKRSPETIVVIMTGGASEETAVQAMKLGADEYLNKPFDTKEIVGLAIKLIDIRKARHDVSKLRRQIREGERYLAHLTKIINEALITTDETGRINFVNRAATNMWGYSEEELLDKDIQFLIRGEATGLLECDIVRDTLRKGKVEGEFNFRKKDQRSFPGTLSTSVIEEKGAKKGIVLVVADLSRVYEVEARLRQSEKLASLGMVVEGVAHEVRNCLTSLGGFTARLQRTTDEDRRSVYTKIILEDVARLEKMVREIEDYVRFSKFYSYNFKKVDVVPIVDSAWERVLEVLPESTTRQVSFKLEAAKDVPKVTGDSAALEEVFYNLILNSYEAMPEGGEIDVKVRRSGPGVSISVKDTGIGILSEEISEIFNPFFTAKTSGAGMGLSKVHLLVEEHRGLVRVSSERKKGATFEVLLPQDRLMSGIYASQESSLFGPATS